MVSSNSQKVYLGSLRSISLPFTYSRHRLLSPSSISVIQTPFAVITKTFETSASINLRLLLIDCHKSFDEDDFSRKPIVPKKVHTPPLHRNC
ncbi:hypothetical protein ACSBR2_007547 [Camellia fascicularis]